MPRENLNSPPGDEKHYPAAPPEEALFDEYVSLGIEALRRENEKHLAVEVAKWNALTPHEKPFEWRGKSAAEILEWRNARVEQLCEGGTHEGGSGLKSTTMEPRCPARGGACLSSCKETPTSPAHSRDLTDAAFTHAGDTKNGAVTVQTKPLKTTYEEKLARWKRAILEEKIIDLDDAAFEEKFAEWHTHALRLEAIKQEIVRLEKKAVELKIEELKEQAAKQQAELEKVAK
jgi:hypothetical protein